MHEGFSEKDMDRIIAWLDEHVTEGWRIGPVQIVVFVSAAIFLIAELIRWL